MTTNFSLRFPGQTFLLEVLLAVTFNVKENFTFDRNARSSLMVDINNGKFRRTFKTKGGSRRFCFSFQKLFKKVKFNGNLKEIPLKALSSSIKSIKD